MPHSALERLGPYELVKNLTRPGRAEVYLGTLLDDQKQVKGRELPKRAVIKVLRPPDHVPASQKGRIEEALARFVEEGRLGTRLRHPAIARTYGVGFDRRQQLNFIIQEYVQGVTLAQVLDDYATRERKLDYSLALNLVIPIFRALHHAYHDALREDGRPLRVVHRDIKPANIMLTYDARVVLLDLASARSTSFTRQATVHDVVVGTAHYLAPEQIFDQTQVGHQTDLFATAVILFELCALAPLLPRTRRLSEIATALSKFDFEDKADLIDPDAYPGLQPVLAQALCPDPTSRFETCGEVARLLDGLLLRAGDGQSLSSLAADMQQRWGEQPMNEIDLKKPLDLKVLGARNVAPILPRSTAEGKTEHSTPNEALPELGEAEVAELEALPRASSSLIELALAALVGLVVASATWLVLGML